MLNQNDQERFTRLWTAHQATVASLLHALARDRAVEKSMSPKLLPLI